MLARFNKIKEDHQNRKAAYATKQGKLETYYEQLEDLGHKTVKSAQDDVRKSTTKLKKLDAEIDALLTEYEEEFDL